jgi:hypothetical protein
VDTGQFQLVFWLLYRSVYVGQGYVVVQKDTSRRNLPKLESTGGNSTGTGSPALALGCSQLEQVTVGAAQQFAFCDCASVQR